MTDRDLERLAISVVRGLAMDGPHAARSGHDAEHLSDGLATTAVAGMFCAGEIGPVGSRHFLHGFTASSLLLGAQSLD